MMTDLSRWPNADDVLDRALALPRHERSTYVRAAAGADGAFAAALEAVLAEDEPADGFLPPGSAMTGPLAADLARAPGADGAEAPRLQAGQTFGGYDVLGVLGHGGMGEVYRARDQRLGRDVALKVLPARFAADPHRHVRLEREARLLAVLNDPHIAAIYQLEEHEDVSALVMELVEGPTLAERLARGRLPIAAALDIAEQIALALVAAHRRGVVHRDLKPSNVKITPDGGVKVLDFGIATAIDTEEAEPATSDSTTRPVSSDAAGPVFGTASYTSPERARGQKTDHRADIWAFGCVLFEMLTGVRAFDGNSPAATMWRVIEREPEFSRLPIRTPAAIHRLLERTLRKDPERRLGFAGDALLDIEDARAELAGAGTQPVPRAQARRATQIAVGTLVAGLAVGAVAMWAWLSPAAPIASHLAVPIPDADDLVVGEVPGLAVSPDGRTIVYRARRGGVIQLVRRTLDAGASVPIEGSADAAAPFFSPDGQWIGFSNDARLMKVSVSGGKPTVVCEAPGFARGSWDRDDTIWFSMNTARVIFRVPAAGGTPEPATALDEAAGDLAHIGPSVLADGRGALVTVTRADGAHLGVARRDSRAVRVLTSGRQPQALADGQFVFARGDALWAGRLRSDRSALAAEPGLALQGLDLGGQSATAHFAVSETGALIYLPRRLAADARVPVWIDRRGQETAMPVEPKPYARATVSPDGTRLALAVTSPDNRDIWIYEMARQNLMRLTVDPAADTAPIWSPDSRRIAFRSERDGGGIFVQAADGAGAAVRVTRSDGPARPAHTPYSFTPDGGTVVFAELRSYSDQAIGQATIDPPASAILLDGPYAETRPALSPNGKWLAYQSDESGRYEIYVRPYPDVTASRVQVSTSGGSSARWSADGTELFFFDSSSITAVPVRPGDTFSIGAPVVLFDAARFNERLGPMYDVALDGRFLFLRAAGSTGEPVRRADLLLVTNWLQTLGAR